MTKLTKTGDTGQEICEGEVEHNTGLKCLQEWDEGIVQKAAKNKLWERPTLHKQDLIVKVT
jgi:hypothetical protein